MLQMGNSHDSWFKTCGGGFDVRYSWLSEAGEGGYVRVGRPILLSALLY